MIGNKRAKRRRGDIRVQLAVSACVLLLPPIGMVAGAMFVGPHSLESAGTQGAAKTGAQAERLDVSTGASPAFALASADQRPVVTEPGPAAQTAAPPGTVPQGMGAQGPTAQGAAGPRPGAVPIPPAAASAAAPQPNAQGAQGPQRQASMQPASTKDAARYSGPAPTLVNAEKSTEQTAMVEKEAPSAVAKAADAPAAGAEDTDAHAHASPAKGKTARTHTAYRNRRSQPFGDIFRSRYR
jgi:hypothetical protein